MAKPERKTIMDKVEPTVQLVEKMERSLLEQEVNRNEDLIKTTKKKTAGSKEKQQRNHLINSAAIVFLAEQEKKRLGSQAEEYEEIENNFITRSVETTDVRKDWLNSLNKRQKEALDSIFSNITKELSFKEAELKKNTASLPAGGVTDLTSKVIESIHTTLVSHTMYKSGGLQTPMSAQITQIINGRAQNEYITILGGGSRDNGANVLNVLKAIEVLKKETENELKMYQSQMEPTEYRYLNKMGIEEEMVGPNILGDITEAVETKKKKTVFYKNIEGLTKDLISTGEVTPVEIENFLRDKLEVLNVGFKQGFETEEYSKESEIDYDQIPTEERIIREDEMARVIKDLKSTKDLARLSESALLLWISSKIGLESFDQMFPNKRQVVKSHFAQLEEEKLIRKKQDQTPVVTSKVRDKFEKRLVYLKKKGFKEMESMRKIHNEVKFDADLSDKLFNIYLYEIDYLPAQEEQELFWEMSSYISSPEELDQRTQEMYTKLKNNNFLKVGTTGREFELTKVALKKQELKLQAKTKASKASRGPRM
jgi:hypothetical protein